MGLFDEITVASELMPERFRHPLVFQTKGLDCFMERYKVDSRGFLWKREVEREFVKDASRIFGGYLKEISSKWVRVRDQNHSIRVYASLPRGRKFHEFLLFFKKGKLLEVKKDGVR
jgi:hypothetical protein